MKCSCVLLVLFVPLISAYIVNPPHIDNAVQRTHQQASPDEPAGVFVGLHAVDLEIASFGSESPGTEPGAPVHDPLQKNIYAVTK